MAALRKSRFHDEKGNFVGWGGMAYAPAALVTAAARVAFGVRPARPMLSYRAVRVIDGLLHTEARGVEFGSGMSTPWLAARAGFLLSIENDAHWHARVGRMLAQRRLQNVAHELRADDNFADLSDQADASFDFALVDGWDRHACVLGVLPKIKPGGWIYLDHSDKDMTIPDGEMRRAEAALLEAVQARRGSAEYFTDFSATNFFAEQGLLARF